MLESLADDLWHDQFDLVIPPRVHMRGRMVVARLADGGLWLWSPMPIDDALAEQISGLGPVRHLVAPNAMHHLHFEAAAARWPEARRYLAPALARKRPELRHDQLLGDEVPAAWAGQIEAHLVGGAPRLDEVVFLHRPSKTLVLCDLVFNLREIRGWVSSLVFRMAGTHRGLAQSRLLRTMIRDREAAAASARRILQWDFERVVMAHGEVLEHDARESLRGALEWMLKGGSAASASATASPERAAS